MKFFIKNFFSKCDQIRSYLQFCLCSGCTNQSITIKIFLTLTSSRNTRFFHHTFIYRSYLMCLCEQLPGNCGMENFNTNVKKVESILKHKRIKILLVNTDKNIATFFPFVSNTKVKLEKETQVSQVLEKFTRFWPVFDNSRDFLWVLFEPT